MEESPKGPLPCLVAGTLVVPTGLERLLELHPIGSLEEVPAALASDPSLVGLIWLPEGPADDVPAPLASLKGRLPMVICGAAPAAGEWAGEDLCLVLPSKAPEVIVPVAWQYLCQSQRICPGHPKLDLHALDLPLLVTDQAGIVLEANALAAKMIGLPLKTLLAKPIGFAVEPGRRTVEREKGKPMLLVNVIPTCWGQRPAYYVALETDLLNTHEQMLSATADHQQEMVMVTDVNGRITYVNPAFERQTGYTLEESIGKKPSMVKSGLHDHDVYRDLWETISGGNCWTGELINCRKDGSHFQVETKVFGIPDNTGDIVAFASVQRDITKEIELEEQLEQAQKMEAIGQLAGGIAHDFNNLLTIILGNSQMAMLRLEQDHPAHAKMEDIRLAADRAAGLTRQLLAFSRKQNNNPSQLDFNVLISEFQKMLSRLIGEDIELVLDLTDQECQVKADSGRLEQVLMNLAVNARDAMPEGGSIALRTRLVELDPDIQPETFFGAKRGTYVCVEMEDTGCGMDDETLNLIFQPFFTTKERDKGTGLGLATVFGIVKELEGHLEVDSKVGEGSLFRFYLPSSLGGEAAEEAEESSLSSEGQEAVLLVEDESGVRQMAMEMLQMLGYQVTCAANATEALDYLSQGHTVDLLLSDIVMPGIDGQELAERAQQQRPDLKVLFMSGYPSHRQASLQDSESYIQKPFTPQALGQKVRDVLDS